jgi:hypothetical protein
MSIRTLRPSVQPRRCSSYERGSTDFGVRILTSYAGEHANAPHPFALLRSRRKRPRRRCAAEERDKLPPMHVPH